MMPRFLSRLAAAALLAACADSTEPRASAPAAPTIVAVAPAPGQLSIAFTAPDDGGAPIRYYEFSLDNGSSWIERTQRDTLSPIIVEGLQDGTTYAVRLRAVNRVGPGPASDVVPESPFRVPDAPNIVAVAPGYRRGDIVLSATFNGGRPITNYQYSIDDGAFWTPLAPAVTSGPVPITGLADNAAYTLRLRSVNAAGVSAASNEAYIGTSPGIPASVTVTADSAGLLLCSAAVAGAASYRFWLAPSRTEPGIASIETTAACERSVGTHTGALYFISASACNTAETCSPRSADVDSVLTRPHVPIWTGWSWPQPGELHATVTTFFSHPAAEVTNWAYSLNDGPWTDIAPASPSSTFVFSGLVSGDSVTVRVLGINAAGRGAPGPTLRLLVP